LYNLNTTDGNIWNTGNARYLHSCNDESGNKINIGVRIKLNARGNIIESAFLDTGCRYVVISKGICENYDIAVCEDYPIRMSTRLGDFSGFINRFPIYFIADNGDSLEVESTCFISEDWPGPIMIGWLGCLERMKFAIDPSCNLFLFAGI